MELSNLCRKYFKTANLYLVLGVDKNSSTCSRDVKRAYFKRSLPFHPDRTHKTAAAIIEASIKFEVLMKVYAVLSDPERKWVYDTTGCIWLPDELSEEDVKYIHLWKQIFKGATQENIILFLIKYRDSEEEVSDIEHLYGLYRGNIDEILNATVAASSRDITRVRSIIQNVKNKDDSVDCSDSMPFDSSKNSNFSEPIEAFSDGEVDRMTLRFANELGLGHIFPRKSPRLLRQRRQESAKKKLSLGMRTRRRGSFNNSVGLTKRALSV